MIAFLAVLAAWIVGETALTRDDRPTGGTLALPTAIVLLASQALAIALHGGTAWSGAVLMIAGVALRLWAIAVLGAAFASALASERLVTRGPYRFARHPSELGLLLIVFGGAWLCSSPAAALVGIAIIPLVAIRCAREDASLARLPGHPAWRARVGWFTPRPIGALLPRYSKRADSAGS